MVRLLIAEDAQDVAEGIVFGVRMMWPDCQVVVAADGRAALAAFVESRPDIVVLDVSMPPPDGFEVCQRIRELSDVPILMLTVRDDTLDKVRALDLGADDYVTKPFEPLELLARLRALLRRQTGRSLPLSRAITVGDVTLDPATRDVRMRDVRIALTSSEFRLLAALMRDAGSVVPHQALLREIWGDEYSGDIQSLKVYIRRLRQKLGDDLKQPHHIQSDWGVGYRFSGSQRP